jgi:hypothetical protein
MILISYGTWIYDLLVILEIGWDFYALTNATLGLKRWILNLQKVFAD